MYILWDLRTSSQYNRDKERFVLHEVPVCEDDIKYDLPKL